MAATKKSAQIQLPPPPDPTTLPGPIASEPAIPRSVLNLRKHPKWGDIHLEVVLGKLTAEAICKKFDVRTPRGNYAVLAIATYRTWLREKNAALFSVIDEMEQKALRGELLDWFKDVNDKANKGYDKALNHKTTISTKVGPVEVEAPDFQAANQFLGAKMQAANHVMSAIAPAPAPAGPAVVQDNRQVIQVMALPRASQQTAQATAQKVIDAVPDPDNPDSDQNRTSH